MFQFCKEAILRGQRRNSTQAINNIRRSNSLPILQPNSSAAAAQNSFSVIEIRADGKVSEQMFTKSSLLTSSKLHGRDLILLLSGLQVRRARPDILVRDTAIVICLSYCRAIIQHDRLLLFHPENTIVKNFVPKLVASITNKPYLPHPFDYLEDETSDFELRAIEAILGSVCETYRKRAALISPLVDGVIKMMSFSKTKIPDALELQDAVFQLLPMKDHLSNFEIETGMARDVLNTLLKNEEDMVGLLLNEKKRRLGALPPLSAHRTVELMLENYTSQLVDISQEAYFLRKRIESTQSIVELSLDSHRNRLLHLSLQLAMGSVSLGWATTIAGFFGMNLTSNLEHVHNAFFFVVVTASGGAGLLFIFLSSLFGKMTPNVEAKSAGFESIFEHLDQIQELFENENLSKEVFRNTMKKINISQEVADMVFHSSVEGQRLDSLKRSQSSLELWRLFDRIKKRTS